MLDIRNVFKNNLILLIAVLCIILIFSLIINEFNKTRYNVDQALPNDAALVLNSIDVNSLFQKASKSELYNDVVNFNEFEAFNNFLINLDSTFHKMPGIKESFRNKKFSLSFHASETEINLLFIIEKPQKSNRWIHNLLTNLYQNHYTVLNERYKGFSINKAVINQYTETLNFTFKGGLLIGSFSIDLLKQSIDQLTSTELSDENDTISKLKATAGRKTDANLFINHSGLEKFNRHIIAPDINPKNNNIAAWTALDLIIKDKELIFSGYSAIESEGDFLFAFKNQIPQRISITSVIPSATTFLYHLGFSDFQELISKQCFTIIKPKDDNRKFREIIINQANKELALCSFARNSSEIIEQSFFVLKVNDKISCNKQIKNLIKINNEKYKSYDIGNSDLKGLIPGIFGNNFKSIQGFHYTFINDYLIVGNSSNALKEFIKIYNSGQSLQQNNNYKSFADNITEESNIYYYINIRNGLFFIEKNMNKKLRRLISNNSIPMKNIYAFGLQFSMTGKYFFTNAFLKYDEGIKDDNPILWNASLDAEISGSPQILRKSADENFIIAFDTFGHIYAFDSNGQRLWKKKLLGHPMGEILELIGNNKTHYLFNTKTHIYLIDELGNNVNNYPIPLKSRSTNSISLFDYSTYGLYRIVFATEDNKVLNYDIGGNKVAGWNKAEVENPITDKIQHLVANNRDYILLSDMEGNIRILNRQGNDRIIMRTAFKKSRNVPFFVNNTNKKGLFITTDNEGKLTYISSDGRIKNTDFGKFSPDHYFLYEDINKDGFEDFIFLDQNKLTVFDRFKEIIFDYEFQEQIQIQPQFFNLSSTESVLCIIASEHQIVHLFNKRGELRSLSGIPGDTQINLGQLNKNQDINLIVGKGDKIFNHRFK